MVVNGAEEVAAEIQLDGGEAARTGGRDLDDPRVHIDSILDSDVGGGNPQRRRRVRLGGGVDDGMTEPSTTSTLVGVASTTSAASLLLWPLRGTGGERAEGWVVGGRGPRRRWGYLKWATWGRQNAD